MGSGGPGSHIWLCGQEAPSDDFGSDGFFYLDLVQKSIYGPKADGSWGVPQSLDDVKHILSANRDPQSSDNGTEGFSAGSVWLNSVGGSSYICTHSDVSGANWDLMIPTAPEAKKKAHFEVEFEGTMDVDATVHFDPPFVKPPTETPRKPVATPGTAVVVKVPRPTTEDVEMGADMSEYPHHRHHDRERRDHNENYLYIDRGHGGHGGGGHHDGDRGRDSHLEHMLLAEGQKTTDARIGEAANSLHNDHLFMTSKMGDGFADAERTERVSDALTNANIDGGFRHTNANIDGGFRATNANVDGGFRATNANIDGSTRFLSKEINDAERAGAAGVLHLDNEIDGVSDDVSANARWINAEQRADTRYLQNSTERNTHWLSDEIDGVGGKVDAGRREALREFGLTNVHITEAERRTEGHVSHVGEELAEGLGELGQRVVDSERRVSDKVSHYGEELSEGFDRAGERLSNAERRIEADVRLEGRDTRSSLGNKIENVDNRLADHDRRAAAKFAALAGEVRLEAERTRELDTRNSLETRLYLRDRQDRTEDLIRLEGGKGRELQRYLYNETSERLDDFERRSHLDEDRTRDVVRHLDEERRERAFAVGLANNTVLRTELAFLRAEAREDGCGGGRRRGGEDEGRGGGCGCGGHRRGGHDENHSHNPNGGDHHRWGSHYDPRINIRIDDRQRSEIDDDVSQGQGQAQGQRQRQRQTGLDIL